MFLPALDTEEINQVTISQHDATPLVTIEHVDGRWSLASPIAVPANASLIESVLLGLKNARVLEQKTAEKDWYKHLGVDDIGETDARGTLILLGAGDTSLQLLVGDKSSKQKGQYWRDTGGNNNPVVRVDQVLDLPRDALDWMDREIIDLPDNGVASINITTRTGDRFVLRRDNYAEELSLGTAVSDSMVLPHSVKQLVFGLSQLNFDAIKVSEGKLTEQLADSIIFSLFDGSAFELLLYPDTEGSWASLKAIDNEQGTGSKLVDKMNSYFSRWHFHLSGQRTALYTQAIMHLSGENNE